MEIGSWVPQAFYDLIGRVAPGALLLLLGFAVFGDTDTTQAWLEASQGSAFPTTVVVLVGTVLSYFVGTLLGGLRFALNHRASPKQWPSTLMPSVWLERTDGPLIKTISSIRAHPPVDDTQTRTDDQVSYMYDFVHLHNPVAGARLAKLRAESHVCWCCSAERLCS